MSSPSTPRHVSGFSPLGWLPSELWDRWRDRAFWASQQALRDVRAGSDGPPGGMLDGAARGAVRKLTRHAGGRARAPGCGARSGALVGLKAYLATGDLILGGGLLGGVLRPLVEAAARDVLVSLYPATRVDNPAE